MSHASAPMFAWTAAGHPAPPYAISPATGPCATCGAHVGGDGVALTQIETPTTSGHADLFRHGTKHVCQACAWLFAAGKGKPGNYIATPWCFESAVISLESVVEDKRPWLRILRDLVTLPPGANVTGVMTTDVKPRLWNRARLATIDRFGLYLHCPDYDVSEYREFSLHACLALIDLMVEPLSAGFAKASVYHGLLRDYARASRHLSAAMEWDAALSAHRNQPHFLPALIAAGVTKECKKDVKSIAKPASDPVPPAAVCDPDHQAQLGLF